MSFTFLAPLFLVGLAAVAVPILIHLTHRTRREPVPFPSLMFLRQIPFKTTKRQRIRNWLLFLLRTAAVLIVVTAFARPFLDRPGATFGLAGAREIVLLIDRSYSMGYGDRWERAVEAAREVVDGLGPEDRATVVFFSDVAEAANRPSGDPAALRAALDGGRVGPRGTRFAPALELARKLLDESNRPQYQVVLVSDFQRVGWERQEAVRLPPGTVFDRVNVSGGTTANVALADALVERAERGGVDGIRVSARVVNRGPDPVSELEVTLSVDDEAVQTRRVDLPANGTATVRFGVVPVPARVVLARVRLADDPLPIDNVRSVAIAPRQRLSVLLVRHAAARPQETIYLRRALAIGERPGFQVDVRSASGLAPADVRGRSAVILHDTPVPGGAAGRALTEYVTGGGGLFLVAGRRSAASRWPADAPDLLPVDLGAPTGPGSDRGGTLADLDYDHPVFQPFRGPRTGDFSAARFFRYRTVEPDSGAAVVARFDDGREALVARRVGDGVVLLWTSGFANLWSDLPLQPVFLPFLHQVVRYLADYRVPRSAFTVGEVVDLAHLRQTLGPTAPQAAEGGEPLELVVETPSEERLLRTVGPDPHYLALEEPGVYAVRPLGSEPDPPALLAVNVDVAESDLTPVDDDEVARTVLPEGPGAAEAGAVDLTVEERERRQGLWWYLLVGGFLLLLAETLLANRPARAVRSAGSIRSA